MVGQRIVNPWPLEASGFDPLLLHQIRDCGGMVYTADLKSAASLIKGSSPFSRTKIGFKVFMDAHGTVTAEEWGSLPPRPAKTCLRSVPFRLERP